MARIVRLVAFLAQETHDLRRQPFLLLLLIFGPFLILLVFGVGFTGQQEPVDMLVVIPENAQVPPGLLDEFARYGGGLNITIGSDTAEAQMKLYRRQIDLAAYVPLRAEGSLASGKQVEVKVAMNTISPFRRDYLNFVSNRVASHINRYLQRQVAAELLDLAGNPENISPDILAEPIVHTTENVAQFQVDYMKFYAPAVLALLLQHIAATFAAMSLVRDRLLGINEVFQASPLHPGEALLGKFLSYMLITLGIGGLLTVVIVFLLEVPLFGDPWAFLLMAVLEIAASLGWGFLISAVSRRESQTVQLTMILLLTSVFFSGFFLVLPSLLPSVRVISYALPVTYAILAFQDIMLAGVVPAPWHFFALGGLAAVSLVAAWLLYRRQFRLA